MSNTKKKKGISHEIILILLIAAFVFLLLVIDAFRNLPNVPGPSGGINFPSEFREEVKYASEKYGIEESRIYAVIMVESKFDPNAVSRAGARGLMQMMPSTYEEYAPKIGREYNPDDLFDPAVNINVCSYYLKWLYDYYEKDWDKAHIAYNAGPGNLNKWLADPELSNNGKITYIPFEQTRKYLEQVNKYYAEYSGEYSEK